MKNRSNNMDKRQFAPGRRQDLAYDNHRFMESDDGRPLRILAEYLEPRAGFAREKIENTVVFFGSARTLPRDVATENLRQLEAAIVFANCLRKSTRFAQVSPVCYRSIHGIDRR